MPKSTKNGTLSKVLSKFTSILKVYHEELIDKDEDREVVVSHEELIDKDEGREVVVQLVVMGYYCGGTLL